MTEIESSAAAGPTAKKAQKKKKSASLGDGDCDRFVGLWNEKALPGWAKIRVVSEDKKKLFTRLVADFGGLEEAIVGLTAALQEAARSPWYREHQLSLANFASNGKIVTMAEKWWDRQSPSGGPIVAEIVESGAIVPAAQKSAEFSLRSTAPDSLIEWWDLWSKGQSALGRIASGFADIQILWEQRYGFDPIPEGLVRGTQIYLRREVDRYRQEGRSFAFGARRFIEQEIWRDALTFSAHCEFLPDSLTSGDSEKIKEEARAERFRQLARERGLVA